MALFNWLYLVMFPICLFSTGGTSSAEDGWGHLRGRLIYDGDLPSVEVTDVTKDAKIFGQTIPVESLLVNRRNGGIANIVIYLKPRKDVKLNIHPSYEKTKKSKVVMKMSGGQFRPHILLLRTSQVLEQVNEDNGKTRYHPWFGSLKNSGPLGASLSLDNHVTRRGFREEPGPFPVHCARYPWIESYILIRDNPYMANTDSDGLFEIRKLPVGEHTFCFWHEKLGLLKRKCIGGYTSSSKGGLSIVIQKGDNTLADTLFSPSVFGITKELSVKENPIDIRSVK